LAAISPKSVNNVWFIDRMLMCSDLRDGTSATSAMRTPSKPSVERKTNVLIACFQPVTEQENTFRRFFVALRG
jgi:hypothetical protein